MGRSSAEHVERNSFMLSLQPPFSKRTKKNLSGEVLRGGAHPRIQRSLLPFTKQVLKRSWSESHTALPNMATIAKLLQSDVDTLLRKILSTPEHNLSPTSPSTSLTVMKRSLVRWHHSTSQNVTRSRSSQPHSCNNAIYFFIMFK